MDITVVTNHKDNSHAVVDGKILTNGELSLLLKSLADAAGVRDTALLFIAGERQRQIVQEGFTLAHDNLHTGGELGLAALSYLETATLQVRGRDTRWRPAWWPFEPAEWKQSEDPLTNLIKAGALIVAEIERIRRARKGKL